MIFKKIVSFDVSIIKLIIVFLLTCEISYSTQTSNKFFANEKGIISIMYHRFNESKYPSTNIQMDVFENHIETIKSLIGKVDFNMGDYDKRTPLHLACSEGKIEIVKYLVDIVKCQIDIKDRWNNTPLDDSIREKHIDIKYYLEKSFTSE